MENFQYSPLNDLEGFLDGHHFELLELPTCFLASSQYQVYQVAVESDQSKIFNILSH